MNYKSKVMGSIGLCICSCGGCRGNTLCEKSRKDTMSANGLPIEWSEELVGLEYKENYSQVRGKVVELIKKMRASYDVSKGNEISPKSDLLIEWYAKQRIPVDHLNQKHQL